MPTKNLTAAFVEKVKPNGKRTDYFDDSLPGFSLRVSEKGVKTWCVSYRFAGKWTRYTFGTYPIILLAEARQTAKDSLHDAAHDINPAAAKREDRDAPTFRMLAERYRDEYAVKKRSYKEMARIIDRLLIPHFGSMQAKEITRKEVKALVGEIAKRAPIMANRTLDLLRRIFKWGIEEDIVCQFPRSFPHLIFTVFPPPAADSLSF